MNRVNPVDRAHLGSDLYRFQSSRLRELVEILAAEKIDMPREVVTAPIAPPKDAEIEAGRIVRNDNESATWLQQPND